MFLKNAKILCLIMCYMDSSVVGEVPVSTRVDLGVGMKSVSDLSVVDWTRVTNN